MDSIIHISGLKRHYWMGDTLVAALDNISLDVHKGDFVMIVGSSGSGKSTLMHLLGLLDVPTGGVLEVGGDRVAECSEARVSRMRNEHIGFVFQSFNLLNDLDVVENIALPLVYRGVPRRLRRERATELAIKLGLGKRLHHHPKELSGGQLQRIAIARALIGEPDILLADEPTGNLDSATSREIMQIFYDLNSQGHTIIMVTHDPKLADQGTRKVTLLDGKIIEDVPGKRQPPAEHPAHQEERRFPGGGSVSIADLVRIGIKEGLLAHQLRTFLTMLGIIIGISSVIAMSSFSLGSKQKQADQIRALGANLVKIVDKQFENERLVEARSRGSSGLGRKDLELLRQGIPDIERAACVRQIKLNVMHELGPLNPRVLGVEGDYLEVNNLAMAEGRFFDRGDWATSECSVVIGSTLAKILAEMRSENKLEPRSPVGEHLLLGGTPYTIVGVLQEKTIDMDELEATSASDPNRDLLLPLETLITRTAYLDLRSEVDEIQLQIRDENALAQAGRAIRSILGVTHAGQNDYDMVIPMDLLKQKQQSQHLLDILTICISSISIVVGGIGIMNIMLASVTERIREIGIRRAIGATKMDIMRQFLTESMTISITGGAFGVILAGIVVVFTCQFLNLPVVFSLQLLCAAVIASTLTGLVFGIYPAYQAANKNPVESLRAE
ncbi:MAG: ATP-binding cassette domain-containing protein [Victivallales bacterium]|nr:ATP-binding cassette domain-containing protein [Victivallales bacterium]